ncbi:MAG: hypothetical protein UT24_C0003G0031 [Candidatus Woesebacteria bacterium GW2011_GWB1_39_12]|uniref:Uncharacterized protein n=1 Tax=Candidatus Woesebacteria bacterium GW2011_GWB1_39_12 TaxID=1618574 RepID=A0A0G0MC72_9BACT|nr:MAG: hypothetical protein UT24_C0003G0031 [Candidatus Woesebacteria bacterium GW2011_GWB1_39_12]
MRLRRNFLVGLATLFRALHIITKNDYENFRLNLALAEAARKHNLKMVSVPLDGE